MTNYLTQLVETGQKLSETGFQISDNDNKDGDANAALESFRKNKVGSTGHGVSEDNRNSQTSNSKKVLRCYRCKQTGHYRSQCTVNKDSSNTRSSDRKQTNAFNAVFLNGIFSKNDWLGHVNSMYLNKMPDAVSGMELENKSDISKLSCIVCCEGKQSRLSFSHVGSRSSELLEIVHSDVCGQWKMLQLVGPETIFMQLPECFPIVNCNQVLRFKKAIYGLKQASLARYDRVCSIQLYI
ncbi:unnamed protein product [Euphydryas editha]|uniref:CCHC-type domain-containing protein n=1 Tax=Euphydryas editha TaxID=104508 RepID=A0AAU9US95_EUPED|nr:unnamed protein product [Euphydryas editha]